MDDGSNQLFYQLILIWSHLITHHTVWCMFISKLPRRSSLVINFNGRHLCWAWGCLYSHEVVLYIVQWRNIWCASQWFGCMSAIILPWKLSFMSMATEKHRICAPKNIYMLFTTWNLRGAEPQIGSWETVSAGMSWGSPLRSDKLWTDDRHNWYQSLTKSPLQYKPL